MPELALELKKGCPGDLGPEQHQNVLLTGGGHEAGWIPLWPGGVHGRPGSYRARRLRAGQIA
eukprot:3327128-Pyramimonas_sp.AAC.1